MTNLITPKIDWSGSVEEFFNVDPDYNRIKNNIKLIFELSKLYYNKEFTIYDMANLVVSTDHVYVDYLNNIVYNLDIIKNNTFEPLRYNVLNVFQQNNTIWTFKDLNNIESNILYLYNSVGSFYNNKNKTGFTLMGVMGGL